MANFLDNNERFHIFSKSPVSSDQGIAQAVNKSGHTVTTSDIWVDDIPWITEAINDKLASNTQLQNITRNSVLNDMVIIPINRVRTVFKRKDTQWDSSNTTFGDYWEEVGNDFQTKIYNSKKELVVLYHKNVEAKLIQASENAEQSSNQALRVWVNCDKSGVPYNNTDTKRMIEQFVSPTDKIVNGLPSTQYRTFVERKYNGKVDTMAEGEDPENYISNAYAGLIQLNYNIDNSTTKKEYISSTYSASVFEYVGKKLNEADFSSNTDDIVNAQKIWDLNHFIYECLRKRKDDSSKYKWVEDYVLNSPNIYIDEEFESKDKWIEYVKAGNDPYNPLIFLNDMYDVSDSSSLSTSAGYSTIGEFVKKMFLQLDEDAEKEWMSDGSFSKKYLKTGLSIKYITYLSIDGNNADLQRPPYFSTISNLNSDYVYPSYTISIYTSPTMLDVEDGQVIFHEPILDYTKFTYDSLTKNKNWNYLISEQEMKITRDYLKNLIKDSTDGLKASQLYTGTLALFTNIDDSRNYVNRENGKGETVGAVDFGSNHFIVGQKINKITIPYDTPSDANVGNHDCHLMMEIFTDNSGTPSQTYSSVNKDSYSTTKKEYNFIFNNVVIPSSYNFVRLSFSEDSQVRSAYKKFRILPLRKLGTTDNPNKDESKVFEEDDACYLHWESSGNISGGANRVGYVEVYYGDTTDILDYVSPDITEDKSEDDISLATVRAIKDYVTGKTPTNITISDGQASTLENQQSVYGNIANDNVLSLGVVSANDNTMGVSKLFTGTLSTATSDATDTAVSLPSIQAMYNSLASLINSSNETITNLTNQITILQNNVVILDNINNGKYDVSRANDTAPDGSEWNEKVHDANNLKINYITYDDTNNLGMMYGTIGDN